MTHLSKIPCEKYGDMLIKKRAEGPRNSAAHIGESKKKKEGIQIHTAKNYVAWEIREERRESSPPVAALEEAKSINPSNRRKQMSAASKKRGMSRKEKRHEHEHFSFRRYIYI